MAITYKGDICLGLSADDSGQTLKRLMVFFCENGETISSLRTHRDFPVLGAAHPELSLLKASSITVTPACDGKKNKYEVEVTYSSQRTAPVLTDTAQFGRPFNVTLSTVEKVVPFEFSYDQTDDSGHPVRPVVTAAGTAIPASTVQTSLLLKFSYRLRSFKPSWILETADTVNRSPIKVCGLDIPAECGLIKTVAAEIISEDSSPHNSVFQVDVCMEISPEGFLRTFPNRSVYFRGPNGNPARIYMAVDSLGNPVYGSDKALAEIADTTSNPVPVDEPLWLSAAGLILSSQDITPGPGNFLRFREKRPHSWSQLSLPRTAAW